MRPVEFRAAAGAGRTPCLNPPRPGAARPWGVAACCWPPATRWRRASAPWPCAASSRASRAPPAGTATSLKDADGAPALLRCAMFRRAASAAGLCARRRPAGRAARPLGVYEARGELQLVVESMQRVGAGTLYEEFLRLRARLEAQGLFDAARKRPLPPATRGAWAWSPRPARRPARRADGAARRAPQCEVVVYPSPVQGAEAPAALVRGAAAGRRAAEVRHAAAGARRRLARRPVGLQRRAGGARRGRLCPLPVVCGVGHETDVTLADLAADLRAPTPTAAAELAAPARAELLAALQRGPSGLRARRARALDRQAQRLDTPRLRLGRPGPRWPASRSAAGAGSGCRRPCSCRHRAGQQPRAAGRRLLQRACGAAALRSGACGWRASPSACRPWTRGSVLQRGYAWVEDGSAAPVVSVHALRRRQHGAAVWADGARGAAVRIEAWSCPAAGLRCRRSAAHAYCRAPHRGPRPRIAALRAATRGPHPQHPRGTDHGTHPARPARTPSMPWRRTTAARRWSSTTASTTTPTW
jgi:exodeoxyribonuclease VII large subunit